MRRLPLRWLLLFPIALILSASALLLGVYLEQSVRADLITGVDAELDRALVLTRPGPERPGDPPERPVGSGDQPATGAFRDGIEVPLEFIIDEDGVTTTRQQNDVDFDISLLADLEGGGRFQTIEGSPRFRVVAAPAREGQTAVVALSLERVDESLASLRRNLIAAGLVLLGAQVLAVWVLAGVVARPVSRMSKVAHEIASGNLDAAVGPAEGSRETADLAGDLRQMLEQLRSTIAEQQQSAAEAIRARNDMERFMADASHELRTPLTALKGYSDLYRGGMLDAEGLDRAMERIGSESERLTDLVVGLLDLMRQGHTHAVGDVDLSTVIERVTADVAAAHPDRDVMCSPNEGAVAVRGDTNSLHQAILNLAINACHHTPRATAVRLEVETDDQCAHILVIDHGPGVDLTRSDQLFVPFARGDESRSRKNHDGAGLGLAIVQQVAELHGGSAWVKATPGGGATFGISLPF